MSLQFLTGKSISQIFYGTHTRFYSKKYLYKEFNSEGFKIKRFIGITRIKNFFFIKKNPLCPFSRDFVFQIALKNE